VALIGFLAGMQGDINPAILMMKSGAMIGIGGRPWKMPAGRSRRGRRDDARRIMARSPMRVRQEVASPQRDRRYQILP